jgi:hypothetical protein
MRTGTLETVQVQPRPIRVGNRVCQISNINFFSKINFFLKQSITISRNAILASNFDATYVDYDTSKTIIYKTFEKNHFLFEHRFDKSQAKRKRNVKSSSALCVLKLFPNQNRSALFFEMKFFDSEEKEKNEFRVFRICILSRTQD